MIFTSDTLLHFRKSIANKQISNQVKSNWKTPTHTHTHTEQQHIGNITTFTTDAAFAFMRIIFHLPAFYGVAEPETPLFYFYVLKKIFDIFFPILFYTTFTAVKIFTEFTSLCITQRCTEAIKINNNKKVK